MTQDRKIFTKPSKFLTKRDSVMLDCFKRNRKFRLEAPTYHLKERGRFFLETTKKKGTPYSLRIKEILYFFISKFCNTALKKYKMDDKTPLYKVFHRLRYIKNQHKIKMKYNTTYILF